ncbi:hypothetical protein [Longispora albida]|uniref:hypothetical protein n=1 Tax=Longispora albida TaxID=203523 RepID=UPI000362B04D|nr:hypothetical protein [Longispora albida]
MSTERRETWSWTWRIALSALVATAILVMTEVDSLLSSLEAASSRSYGFAQLTGPAKDSAPVASALEHWARTAGDTHPFRWIMWHAMADMVFAAGYALALAWALRRLGVGIRMRWLWLGIVAPDVLENVLTFLVAAQSDGAPRPYEVPGLARVLFAVSDLKWAVVAAAAGVIAWRWLARTLHSVQETMSDVARGGDLPQPWVAWTFRVQAGVLALLAFAIAVPGRDRLGALQQLPDVLRSYADKDVDWRWFALSGLALAALAAVVFVTAHWLPFGPVDSGRPGSGRLYTACAVLGGLALVVALLELTAPGLLRDARLVSAGEWVSGLDLAAPVLVIAALFLGTWFVHWRFARDAPPARRPQWTNQHARFVYLLTAAVLISGGLGLVRAFAGPVLLEPKLRPIVFFVMGVAAATLGGAFVFAVLAWVFRCRKVHVPAWLTVLTAVLTLALAVVMMVAPDRAAPPFGTNGVLALALAVGCVAAGGLVAASQRSAAFIAPRGNGRALPALVLTLALLVGAGMADPAGTYHDGRVLGADGNGSGTGLTESVSDAFTRWQQAAKGCTPEATTGHPVQPMLFVAAAGGGIRAAYWTEKALAALTDADPATRDCRRKSVFVVSSVSGASLGAAAWGMGPSDEPRTTALSSQDGLSVIGATWLFRDLPRAGTGLNVQASDRAALMERTWERTTGGLDASYFRTGPDWQPALVFNATDMLTGCRVVISRLRAGQPGHRLPPYHCEDPGVTGSDIPGSYYAADFLNPGSCARSGDLRRSTAALLSARFPYVTPTGLLYHCRGNGTTTPRRVQLGDGGYLENTGMLTALDLWRTIEPQVAAANREAMTRPGAPLIAPVFAEIGNGYRSVADSAEPGRKRELAAPLSGLVIPKSGLSGPRLEAEARATFFADIPGTPVQVPGPMARRHLTLAPGSRPEVSAPLGWALSELSRASLDGQISRLTAVGDARDLLDGRLSITA